MPKDTIIHQTYLLDEMLKQKRVTGTLAQTHKEYWSYLQSGNYIISKIFNQKDV